MKTADAVIVGAGVNGASIAFNLLTQGLRKVVLIERHLLASGGTGKSAAIVRQHYSNVPLIQMMKRCLHVFAHFEEVVGGCAGFVNTGWVFLTPPDAAEGFARNLSRLQSLGIRTWRISREELLELEPRFHLEDVGQIAYEPDSGYADPYLTTCSYIRACQQRGGELIQGSPVTGLGVQGDTVKEVQTSRERISTNIVVNAAGPWANGIAGLVGLILPLQVSLEEEIILVPPTGQAPLGLTVSDMAEAIYYRPEKGFVLVGRGFPKTYKYIDPDDAPSEVEFEFIEDTAQRVARRIPVYKHALVQRAYTGLYDITPDWHPVLGKTSVAGFYLAAGFSGHGFKLAPVIGELISEEIVEGESKTIDISAFRLDRFAKGKLFTAAYGGNRA